MLNVFWVGIGCDPANKPSQRQTEFSDSGFPIGKVAAEESKPLISGRKNYEDIVPAAEIPYQEHHAPTVEPKPKEPFQIANPKLVIDVDKAEVDFQVEIVTDKGRESVHLKGPFNKSEAPWVAHLYAVDQKILEERRVSASVVCVTAYYCDSIGIKIHYTVDGKPTSIYRESGVEGPRMAMSGDDDEAKAEVAEGVKGQTVKPAFEVDETTGTAKPVEAPDVRPRPTSPELPKVVEQPEAAKQPKVTKQPEPAAPVEARVPPQRNAAMPPKKRPAPVRLEDIDPEERKKLLIGVTTEIYVPNPPKDDKFRVRGIAEEPPTPVSEFQAHGHHRGGFLKKSTFIPPESEGFVRAAKLLNKSIAPEKDSSGAFTTKYGLDYLNEVSRELIKKYPGEQIIIGAVSSQHGGHRSGHSSHQIGLDFDIYFLSKSGKQVSYDAILSEGGSFVPEWDVAKNYDLMKTLVALRPDQVIVAFLHNRLTQALCDHAKKSGEPVNEPGSPAFELFRRLRPETRVDRETKRVYFPFTHHDHVHVRLKCNPNDRFCRYEKLGLPAQGNCR